MKYQILWDDDISDLANQINTLLKEGWRPQGGVACFNGNYFQAMIYGHSTCDSNI